MASPTSWVVSSALPIARTASSTRWPSWASAFSVTGRLWHAMHTPLLITFPNMQPPGHRTPAPDDQGHQDLGAATLSASPQDRPPAQVRTRLAREDVAQADAIGRVTINEVGQSFDGDQADRDQQHDERSMQTRPHCPQSNGRMLHVLGNGASP
jgi:hypothetical protein